MKYITLVVAIIGMIFSTTAQNSVKLKTINTTIGDDNMQQTIENLDGAVINVDSQTNLIPLLHVVNISNDTFPATAWYEVTVEFLLYADTGLVDIDRNPSGRYPGMIDAILPNDTLSPFYLFMIFPIQSIIDYCHAQGVELEDIVYWQTISGISATSEEGEYSDSIFYAGADTATFRMVRTATGIEIRKIEQNISVFPIPAQNQMIVMDAQNADLQLFNIIGQQVLQQHSDLDKAVLDVSYLPSGIYVLKMLKNNAVLTKKVEITK
ncbi:MAG: T9SS type A sorting domain-containing protein [Bacteroidales bacterium]|jgi:hypothetical protein|nr:T9SS type A sorting domain-containing protein [Bacteroidales bacterium]